MVNDPVRIHPMEKVISCSISLNDLNFFGGSTQDDRKQTDGILLWQNAKLIYEFRVCGIVEWGLFMVDRYKWPYFGAGGDPYI